MGQDKGFKTECAFGFHPRPRKGTSFSECSVPSLDVAGAAQGYLLGQFTASSRRGYELSLELTAINLVCLFLLLLTLVEY